MAAVTGEMGDEQRSQQVAELATSPRRLLIATDCLSEGVNLQQHFDAVLHYLDFGRSSGVAEGLGQMLHELAREFYAIGVASGQRETLVGPEFAAD